MRRALLSVSSNSGSPPVSLISWSRSSIAPSSRISVPVRSPPAAGGVDDRWPAPTRALDFAWAVPLPVSPRSLRTLPIRLVLIVPSFPASRHASAIASFPASGWSTRYSFKNIDFPSVFPFTVAMRVAPFNEKSRLHAYSVTHGKPDCALSGHDRDEAVRTAQTEYNRDRPVVIVGSSRGWSGSLLGAHFYRGNGRSAQRRPPLFTQSSFRMAARSAGHDRESFLMHVLISQSVNRMASPAFWLAISDLSTRSSALAVFTVLSLIGLAVLGVLYYRKRQLQGAVDAQFRGFREKAVALMDQIDSLRKRHKTLPSTDPDFTAPMTGVTLALYNQVEHDLDDLWSRWLEVMETWDRVERQIRAGSGLTLKPTEEARKLIEQGGIDTLLRQSSACRQKLDRLNQGHEQAREALAAGRAELKALHDAPELLDRHDRAEEIARQVASSERLFEEAERLITADPIGTQELIVRARRNLAAASARPREQPRSPWEVRPTYPLIDDLSARFHQLRQAATNLFRTSHADAFVRGWMLFWVLGLMLVFFTPFLPLAIVLLGVLVILAGFWTLWRIVASWFWFGMWHMWR